MSPRIDDDLSANNCCAAYARVSSDRQNPLSPTDQIRKCQEFARDNHLIVLDGHIYIDDALSGVGSDRPSFQKMLNVALSPTRPFNTILVDDTSRLSRSLPEAMTTIEKLRFVGIRVIFISQGIDTHSEQSDVQVTVHGLVDSLYVKELAKKTHRGLESCALRGLHTGGRCYGYRTVPVGEGESMRRVINEPEAKIVKRIFEMSASGVSLKKITKCLNVECIEPPRSRTARGTWCPTAIREMLKRELYKGWDVWNRTKFVKVPGTNKRRSRPRPQGEWKRRFDPELVILSEELWEQVQRRLNSFNGSGRDKSNRGLLSRSVTSPYLFSNRLKCGRCGSSLIVSSGGKKKPKYVCTGYINRGICTNNLRIGAEEVERQLLAKLQEDLLQPDRINFAVEEFGRQLRLSLDGLTDELSEMRLRKERLEKEIRNFTKAIAESGHSKYIVEEIAVREKEIAAITDRLLASAPDSLESRLGDFKQFVEDGVRSLSKLLRENAPLAKQELHSHLLGVQMYPYEDTEGFCYIAQGNWDLLGIDLTALRSSAPEMGRFEMVAGGGFEPPTFGL
jgi:site-specific DNA recombinase